MKIGIAIPTRGDRSIFLNKCLSMINNQTMKADIVHIVSEEPKSEAKDITYRYRKAFNILFKELACDVVFLFEDDDFYAPNYIETMIAAWIENGSPDVFGIGETTYYHLTKKKYTTFAHEKRSSAFCTMVCEEVLDIDFPADDYSFLDLEIWKQMQGKTFIPEEKICLGIKHGVGVCGGRGHFEQFPYSEDDSELEFLKSVTGEMFFSYKNLMNQN